MSLRTARSLLEDVKRMNSSIMAWTSWKTGDLKGGRQRATDVGVMIFAAFRPVWPLTGPPGQPTYSIPKATTLRTPQGKFISSHDFLGSAKLRDATETGADHDFCSESRVVRATQDHTIWTHYMPDTIRTENSRFI